MMKRSPDPTSSTKQHSYFDDSSSEEDDNDVTRTRKSSADQYDVIDHFKKFCKSHNFFTVQQSGKYKNAFYSHALGVQILRHPTVMKYYSEYKKEYLNYDPDNCNDMLTDEVVEGWIKENIRITLETGV